MAFPQPLLAYAYNFAHPSEPDALFFPAGAGVAFRKTLQGAIDSIRRLALQMNKSEAFAAASKCSRRIVRRWKNSALMPLIDARILR